MAKCYLVLTNVVFPPLQIILKGWFSFERKQKTISIAECLPAAVDSGCFSLGGSVTLLGGQKGMTEGPQLRPVRHRRGLDLKCHALLFWAILSCEKCRTTSALYLNLWCWPHLLEEDRDRTHSAGILEDKNSLVPKFQKAMLRHLSASVSLFWVCFKFFFILLGWFQKIPQLRPLLNGGGDVAWWHCWSVLACDEWDHRPWARWSGLGIQDHVGPVTLGQALLVYLCFHFLVCRVGMISFCDEIHGGEVS